LGRSAGGPAAAVNFQAAATALAYTLVLTGQRLTWTVTYHHVVPWEVAVDALVGVESQELSDDLYGENLRVGGLRGGAALAPECRVFEPVVDEAEDSHDEGAKILGRRPPLRCSVLLGQHRP
jgi:hypothetical protein